MQLSHLVFCDLEWLGELTKQLQKTRTISIGGCLKRFFSEDDLKDLINGEIQEEKKAEDDSFLLFDPSAIVRCYKKSKGKKINKNECHFKKLILSIIDLHFYS